METETIKKLPLHEEHVRRGAKMIPFAGFEMPVSYKGVNEEHLCVRNNAGIFDVSHMGEFIIQGDRALDFIQYVTCNDASRLTPGKVQYSALMNERGGIVDDLLIYCLKPDQYLLVVNAANIEKDKNHLQRYLAPYQVSLLDKSEEYSLFAVQGPRAGEIIQKLTDLDLQQIPYYSFVIGKMAEIPEIIISNTGYTGAGGFELYVSAADAYTLWSRLITAGEPHGLMPAGLGARDTLRLEMGFCLYGNDIDDNTTPLEAGLGWITKLEKGDFLGKEILQKQKNDGISRKLSGFIMQERGIPRSGYEVLNEENQRIGRVTSGTQSPVLQQGIGLAYLDIQYSQPGQEIFIVIRDKKYKAKVTKTPFISKK